MRLQGLWIGFPGNQDKVLVIEGNFPFEMAWYLSWESWKDIRIIIQWFHID